VSARRVIVAWLLAASTWTAQVVRAQPEHDAPSVSAPLKPRAAAPASGVVNLNEASSEELERLPGVGPTKARAIVEHRRAHPFHKIDEITKVKGIGRKTYGKLRPYITVVGPTTLKEQPRN
jgi:competence protein ComEA